MAQVTVAFDAWKAGHVHPNRNSTLWEIRFSPDGKRIMGGDYPGGVVVVWDIASAKQLTAIETGYGLRRGGEFFSISPDWHTLFVSREKRKFERIEKDGKRMLRWECDGEVRAWDLDTGQLIRSYKHQPPRNIDWMMLSPDGTKFVTFDELPGVYEHQPKSAVSIWNVKSGEYLQLPDGLQSGGRFSTDGRTLAITAIDKDGNAQALELFDTNSGKEKLTIPIKQPKAQVAPQAFSPDRRLLVGNYQESWNSDKSTRGLKWWDTTAGKEFGSFTAEKDEHLMYARFSTDGKMLAVASWGPADPKVLLFGINDKQQANAVVLGKKVKGTRFVTHQPVFSPDDKSLAVITQEYPEDQSGQELDAQDVPQGRIHLINVASGETWETLISPPAFTIKVCFSPDGKTLATSGLGRVLLWDVSDLAGQKVGVRERPGISNHETNDD
jgi:WD40 repeat protein